MYKNTILLITCFTLAACDSEYQLPEEYQHVRVYKDDLAPACDGDQAISLKTHGIELINENVEIHCSQKGHDGYAYTESCGSETGSINIFTIHYGDLATAESLGFSRLADLPDAQLDEYCEYKVISDPHKYHLLNHLMENQETWQQINAVSYKFDLHTSYTDCPTFAPMPEVEITVDNNSISTVYDKTNEITLTDLDNYFTLDELLTDLIVSLKLTPIEAGKSPSKLNILPISNNMGIPESYFINAGSDECDAISYNINNVEIISID